MESSWRWRRVCEDEGCAGGWWRAVGRGGEDERDDACAAEGRAVTECGVAPATLFIGRALRMRSWPGVVLSVE